MTRLPPRCTPTATRFPYTTRFRSRRRGTGLSPDPRAVEHDAMVVCGREQARAAKAQEPAIDCRHRWKILGQHAPGTPSPQHVEDGVHDLANRDRKSTRLNSSH